MPFICVDASFSLKIVLPEEESDLVAAKWEEWLTGEFTIVAPWLFAFEVQAVLRQRVTRKELSEQDGLTAWNTLWELGIELHHDPSLWMLSWELAKKYHRPTTYDTAYLALAKILDCELWTADRRFVRSLGGKKTRIQCIEI